MSQPRAHEHSPPEKPPISPDGEDRHAPLVSVVIPCLNEAENIEVLRDRRTLSAAPHGAIAGEVLVVDNASEDDSAALAAAAGAGSSPSPAAATAAPYLAGFAAARGEYIVMADADLTYDFNEIPAS